MIKTILWIGLGGGIGSIARYLFQRWISYLYPHAFPWGTLGVNIIGCFLIGLIWGFSVRNNSENENLKLFLMLGLCGGFTTFSAFTLEGVNLLKDSRVFVFLLYVGSSVMLGLFATWLGLRLSK